MERKKQKRLMNLFQAAALVTAALCTASSCTGNRSAGQGVSANTETVHVKKEGSITELENQDYQMKIEAHLELDEEKTLFSCSRMKYDAGYYFLAETGRNQTILVFDSLGNYVSKLGDKGRKESEYETEITDWFYIPDAGKVLVYEGQKSMLHVFAIGGDYVKTIRFSQLYPDAIGAIAYDKIYCLCQRKAGEDGDAAQLCTVSDNGEIIESLISLEDDMAFVPHKRCFHSYQNRLYHIPSYADSAIVFNRNSVEKVVRFTFDDDFLTEKEKAEACAGQIESYFHFKGIQSIVAYYETSRFHYLVYVDSGTYWHHLIDKENGKQYRFNTDMTKGLFPGSALCVRDNKLLYYVSKEKIDEMRQIIDPDAYEKLLAKSHETIQRIFRGDEQLPLILSIEIKE